MTDAGSNTVCRFYANGNMRGKLKVRIEARSDGKPYTLSPSELKKVRLVDYDHGKDLSSLGYTISMEKGEFSDSFPGTMQAGLQPCSDGQITERWVSIHQEQGVQLKIAAMVEQPDGKKISTRGRTDESGKDTNVMLKGEPPLIYKRSNITVSNQQEANGKYKYYYKEYGPCEGGSCKERTEYFYWNQVNYYISLTHTLLKADIYEYRSEPNHPTEKDGYANLINSYAYLSNQDNLKLFYIWPFEKKSTKSVGILKVNKGTYWTGVDWVESRNANHEIQVNQQHRALCITRMHYECDTAGWGEEFFYPQCGFDVWDEYGNTGKFGASYDQNHNEVVIKDTNTLKSNISSLSQSSLTFFKQPAIDTSSEPKNDDTLSKETEQKPNLGSKG
jgi:hypothetical protein